MKRLVIILFLAAFLGCATAQTKPPDAKVTEEENNVDENSTTLQDQIEKEFTIYSIMDLLSIGWSVLTVH